MAQLVASCAPASSPSTAFQPELYPRADAILWGYQKFDVVYDHSKALLLKAMTYDIGKGPQNFISAPNSFRSDPGHFEAILCVECLHSSGVDVNVEFDERTPQATIHRHYQTVAQPTIKISSDQDPKATSVSLDASGSMTTSGHPLSFTWVQGGSISSGPRLTTDANTLDRQPVYVKADSDLATADSIVWRGADGKVVQIANDNFVCTSLNVVKAGTSFLNPEVTLGPSLKVGTQLEATGGKLSKDYFLSYAFEVRGVVTPAKDKELQEGQDIARTVNYVGSDPTKAQPKEGKKRKSRGSEDTEADDVKAPYPDTPSPPDDWQKLVGDDYEYHPVNGSFHPDGTKPDLSQDVKGKGVYVDQSSKEIMIIWLDQPGFQKLGQGADVSQGMYYRAYFRAWMNPDLAKCEKFFKVEIEVDKTGVVTKNDLTVLN